MESERIALSLPHMGGNEQKYVDKAIETNWVVPLGPDVQGAKPVFVDSEPDTWNMSPQLLEEVRVACEKMNIETGPLWKPMHLQPVYADCQIQIVIANVQRAIDSRRNA